MVVLFQILLFAAVYIARGWYLLGRHLKDISGTNRLIYERMGRNSRHGVYRVLSRHLGLKREEGGIPFIIRRERWYHRLLKAVGLATELQLGDEAFNQRYFITTDYPDDLQRAANATRTMNALKELLDMGVDAIHAMPNLIWCIDSSQASDNATNVERIYTLLEDIAKHTRRSTALLSISPDTPRHRAPIAFFVIGVHMGLLAFGASEIFYSHALDTTDIIDNEALITRSATAMLFGMGAWLMLLYYFFARTPWICWVLGDFVLCGVAGFALSTTAILREANIQLPQASPREYMQPITAKSCTLHCSKSCGKHCTRRSHYTLTEESCTPSARAQFQQERRADDYICENNSWYDYDLRIQHWQSGQDYRFSPSVRQFDSMASGMMVTVPVYNGALGMEWLNSNDILPR